MKIKYVKVWDDIKFSYVKHIVLQVEETDLFMISAGFDPGYKIIIQAVYHNVGAAGGYEFNPYHNNSARQLSRKLDYVESDVLGFYLDHVDDIYDLPDDLNTESIWGSIVTSNKEEKNEIFYESEDLYYKVLHTSELKFETLGEQFEHLKNIVNRNENLFRDMPDLYKFLEKEEKGYENLGFNSQKLKKQIRFAIIDKNSLKIIDDRYSIPIDSTIADYLWCPFEILPDVLWKDVQIKNDDFSSQRIYKLEEGL